VVEVTLHLKAPGPACAVCGVDLNRRVSRWWLANCWTADPKHYRAQQSCHPAETVRPCGVLDRSKTPNVGAKLETTAAPK
jgi:hypothetical protein